MQLKVTGSTVLKKLESRKKKNPNLNWSSIPIKQVIVKDQLTNYYITVEWSVSALKEFILVGRGI